MTICVTVTFEWPALLLITNLNYPRINQLYKNKARNISFEEIDILTNVLGCSISDLIEKKNS